MRIFRRFLFLILTAGALLAFASCGGSDVTTAAVEPETAFADDPADEDHEGEDHDDEDHDDEDHEGEDHDDEDHDDEDHDDHGDEDHDDEDHDDHEGEDDHDHEGEEGSAGLDAHVHGVAELFVAWTGGDVVVDLISPAENIFGFEYEAESEEDLAIVAAATEALTSPTILAFNAEAGCTLSSEVDPDTEFEGTHAEITTAWEFVCDNPDQITELDATELFGAFPGILDLDTQWASDSAQSAAELNASSPVLRFE